MIALIHLVPLLQLLLTLAAAMEILFPTAMQHHPP